MYADVVQRTQIYLDDEESDLLSQAASRTGASRSELIRRAIRTQYGARTTERRLAALRASAGSWEGRNATGAEYVEDVRGDLNERFEEIGLR
jgi:predicted transcriptional regulator